MVLRLCCQLSRDLWDTGREQQQVICLWVVGLQCVPGVLVQGFPRLGERARGHLCGLFFLAEISFAWCRPSGVNGTYASLRHCSRRGSRSAPRDTSKASPSVLETKKCCNSWSASVVTPKTWRLDSEIFCFLLFLHATLHVSAVHAPHQQSPLPSTTRVSNSHRASAGTDLASKLFGSTNQVRCVPRETSRASS